MSSIVREATESLIASDLYKAGIANTQLKSLEDFLSTCSGLGDILSVDDVSLVAGSHRHVSNPGSIPFHSDGPAADVVAWFCIRQDDDAGESVLVDAVPALRLLEPAIRQMLASVDIPYFDQSRLGRPSGYCKVLRGHDEQDWRVNYAPWLLPEMTDAQKAAIAAFEDALSKIAATSIRLAAGQSLFIDNWRILHARGPLKPASSRHLKRVWLRTARRSRMETIPRHTEDAAGCDNL